MNKIKNCLLLIVCAGISYTQYSHAMFSKFFGYVSEEKGESIVTEHENREIQDFYENFIENVENNQKKLVLKEYKKSEWVDSEALLNAAKKLVALKTEVENKKIEEKYQDEKQEKRRLEKRAKLTKHAEKLVEKIYPKKKSYAHVVSAKFIDEKNETLFLKDKNSNISEMFKFLCTVYGALRKGDIYFEDFVTIMNDSGLSTATIVSGELLKKSKKLNKISSKDLANMRLRVKEGKISGNDGMRKIHVDDIKKTYKTEYDNQDDDYTYIDLARSCKTAKSCNTTSKENVKKSWFF